MFWNIEFRETRPCFWVVVFSFFFPKAIGSLLLWFGREAMSTLPLVIKEFREILHFLLHCSVTEGASWMGLGSESQQRKRKAPAPPPTPISITPGPDDTSTSAAPTPDSPATETPTPAFRTKVAQSTTVYTTTVVTQTVKPAPLTTAVQPLPVCTDTAPSKSPTPSSSTTDSLAVQDSSSELSHSLDDSDLDPDQSSSLCSTLTSSTVSGSVRVQPTMRSSSSRMEESEEVSSVAVELNQEVTSASSSRSETESALNLKMDEVENNRNSAVVYCCGPMRLRSKHSWSLSLAWPFLHPPIVFHQSSLLILHPSFFGWTSFCSSFPPIIVFKFFLFVCGYSLIYIVIFTVSFLLFAFTWCQPPYDYLFASLLVRIQIWFCWGHNMLQVKASCSLQFHP